MRLFGPGTLPLRLGYLLVHTALTLAVYAVARRYVPAWVAAVLAIPVATFGYSPDHFHFAGSVALLLWGLWFVLRADDFEPLSVWRVGAGAFLIGWAFWGRYELAPVGVAGVVAVWAFLRPRLGRGGWSVLVVGLLPSTLFLIFLVGVVGIERAWLNLVQYPFFSYPDASCRGLPPVWGEAWAALGAPLGGRFWTSEQLTLGVNTWIAPGVGFLAFLAGFGRRASRPTRAIVSMCIGALVMVLWLAMRARAGAEPHPVWYAVMPAVGVLLSGLFARRVISGRVAAVAVAILLCPVVAVFWLPNAVRMWGSWPPLHPMYGFARVGEDVVFDARIWSEMVGAVRRHAPPGDPIFVAVTSNTGHHSNMPVFYWLSDRPPGSRFIEFNPCLTDTRPIQQAIVRELRDVDVVVATGYFPQDPPPGGPPSMVLDDYLARHFASVYVASLLYPEDLQVLVRTSDVSA